jgi:hypothetical protein
MRIAVPFSSTIARRFLVPATAPGPDRALHVGLICGDARLVRDGRLNIARRRQNTE